jgi:hypothetical protein
MTKASWLFLFKKIIAVYNENHADPVTQNTALQTVKIAGAHN